MSAIEILKALIALPEFPPTPDFVQLQNQAREEISRLEAQERIDELLEKIRGYTRFTSDIDREVIEDGEGTTCEECGSKMRYEGWKKTGSYLALAVCTNLGCRAWWEF